MTNHTIAVILVAGLVCIALRAMPFLLFGRGGRKPPPFVTYLGMVLSAATIAVLVVYCLGGTIATRPGPGPGAPAWQFGGLAELAAAILVAGLHWWLQRPVLAIFAGTAAYMAMIQLCGL